jgi:hypothetical protein
MAVESLWHFRGAKRELLGQALVRLYHWSKNIEIRIYPKFKKVRSTEYLCRALRKLLSLNTKHLVLSLAVLSLFSVDDVGFRRGLRRRRSVEGGSAPE